MEQVVLTGWEITINQNGVKMATLNHERFISYLKYVEWLEEQVKLCNKPAVINNEVAACSNCRFNKSETYHDTMWCRDCQQKNHFEQADL